MVEIADFTNNVMLGIPIVISVIVVIAGIGKPVNNARNLDIIVENDLKMNLFVNNICRSASYALYRIGQIRKFLDKKSTEIRLDQCNSLLYGLPDSQITKLQRIQNFAAI